MNIKRKKKNDTLYVFVGWRAATTSFGKGVVRDVLFIYFFIVSTALDLWLKVVININRFPRVPCGLWLFWRSEFFFLENSHFSTREIHDSRDQDYFHWDVLSVQLNPNCNCLQMDLLKRKEHRWSNAKYVTICQTNHVDDLILYIVSYKITTDFSSRVRAANINSHIDLCTLYRVIKKKKIVVC